MFERSFAWAMRHGSRLLFAAACVMLLVGIISFGVSFMPRMLKWVPGDALSFSLQLVYAHFAPAAYLLFGAVLIERIGRNA